MRILYEGMYVRDNASNQKWVFLQKHSDFMELEYCGYLSCTIPPFSIRQYIVYSLLGAPFSFFLAENSKEILGFYKESHRVLQKKNGITGVTKRVVIISISPLQPLFLIKCIYTIIRR